MSFELPDVNIPCWLSEFPTKTLPPWAAVLCRAHLLASPPSLTTQPPFHLQAGFGTSLGVCLFSISIYSAMIMEPVLHCEKSINKVSWCPCSPLLPFQKMKNPSVLLNTSMVVLKSLLLAMHIQALLMAVVSGSMEQDCGVSIQTLAARS